MNNEIILFNSEDGEISLNVELLDETVWLTQNQMALLFGTTRQAITHHISNIFKEKELSEQASAKNICGTNTEASRPPKYYNLDVIISVGYRVKSQRGVEFRKWATSVLRQYVLEGHAENTKRLAQLGQTIELIKRLPQSLEASQILEIVSSYTKALDLLDDYDHQRIKQPKGSKTTYELKYDECRSIINEMKFNKESDLFGVEKDESFKASIGNIYQTFGGKELYPSTQEKASNLLYFIVKNHSFLDGNKRIAAAMFLYFLDKNGSLYTNGSKNIDDAALVALTIMIAESKPEEKDIMVNLVMNFLDLK